MTFERNDSDRPAITPQQYEVLHGGGAEAAEIANQRLSRRRFLRRSMLAVWGLSTTAATAGALFMLYPNLSGQFGSDLTVGTRDQFPAAQPSQFQKDKAGVFYRQQAKSYIMHLAAGTPLLLQGSKLSDQMDFEAWVKDEKDGSYWVALYQRCVHLGCTVPFRDDCSSFKCPCHGSHYNVDGEYLDGPAPRSLDRFKMSLSGNNVVVSTGTLVNTVLHPVPGTQILPAPKVPCAAS